MNAKRITELMEEHYIPMSEAKEILAREKLIEYINNADNFQKIQNILRIFAKYVKIRDC